MLYHCFARLQPVYAWFLNVDNLWLVLLLLIISGVHLWAVGRAILQESEDERFCASPVGLCCMHDVPASIPAGRQIVIRDVFDSSYWVTFAEIVKYLINSVHWIHLVFNSHSWLGDRYHDRHSECCVDMLYRWLDICSFLGLVWCTVDCFYHAMPC